MLPVLRNADAKADHCKWHRKYGVTEFYKRKICANAGDQAGGFPAKVILMETRKLSGG
jgi:hypothetical protein